jgi:hypothetical protein
VILGLLLVLGTMAQGTPQCFEEYPAEQTSQGVPAAPNLTSHAMARRYRTVLRKAAKEGPDFAGHYMLVRIGCGTSCVQIAVLDAVDGTVYFPRGLRMVQWAGWWHEPYGPDYRLSSRLVRVYGSANTEDAAYGVSDFLWTGKDFQLLRFEKRDSGRPSR